MNSPWLIQAFDPRTDGPRWGLRELWLDAYAIEARLAGNERFWPLQRDPTVPTSGARWLGVVAEQRLIGALEFERHDALLDLQSLVVAPAWHRRGLARALLSAALNDTDWRLATVSTASANDPALRLYQSLGFVKVGCRTEVDGTATTQLELRRTDTPASP